MEITLAKEEKVFSRVTDRKWETDEIKCNQNQDLSYSISNVQWPGLVTDHAVIH